MVRAPAVLTVLGDTLAGGAAAGQPLWGRRLALPVASACLYAAGMALNDYADRELDAVERPERPIPSGRITSRAALGTAAGLTGLGLALSLAGGGRGSGAVALPLAASIWTYDLVAKRNAVTGAAAMGVCRGLDVLMGAGAERARAALPAAVVMGSHTVAVTALSRGEVNGTERGTASAAVATTAAVTTAVVSGALHAAGPANPGRVLPVVAAAAVYAARCGRPQWRAAERPTAANALEATKNGIRSMLPLQAALALRHGSWHAAAVIGAVDVAGRLLRTRTSGRKVSES
nr:UbiA family prenyltransferase [Zhihengliuella flava]